VIEKSERAFQLKALIIDDELEDATSWGRASRALVSELQARHIAVVTATSPEDGEAIVISDAGLHAVLVDWTFRRDDPDTKAKVRSLLHRVRLHYPASPSSSWRNGTKPAYFHRGRITAAIHRYREHILGPMASALFKFAQVSEYSWHTPGHSGGTAFLKSPPGRLFYDYFCENLFRSDLSLAWPSWVPCSITQVRSGKVKNTPPGFSEPTPRTA
jgi:arginine decarboxylase